MSVCVPLVPILLRGYERITFKIVIFKYYGVSKKWKMAKKGGWATIATIVSRENVCLFPLATKCSTDILLRDNERITFKTIIFKYYGVSKKWKKGTNGTLVTTFTIVSIKNVRLCPHHTQML